MDVEDMTRYVCETFDGVDTLEANGDTFFIYDPDRDLPADRQLPFATIVTGDHYDDASTLSRPGAWRLNIGLTRSAYGALFPRRHGSDGDIDHTVTDTVLPHPVYARQHWVCVVNPGEATVDTVRRLLTEAYDFAARKHTNHRSRQAPS
ncbi:DUF6194 family protein [Micromonospora peucetia]|uniref:DUF6194 family protein n=1 Tax=Micromonospora peucetia TaxID=47871 RepID=UPI00225A9B9A|nr:DUF6194 family protein [Micromonospora peucetia]MCX4391118.1 DUF6194 family protein [Micromonospora peucetia]